MLTQAAPAVMLALLTLTVSVCYIMLLRQGTETSAVSWDTFSPLLPLQEAGLQRMGSSLRPSVARPTCLTIEIVINQSVCLFSNQFPFKKKKNICPCPLVWALTCECVCINAADWNNALFSVIIRDVLHSSIISENIHHLVFHSFSLEKSLPILSDTFPPPRYTSKLSRPDWWLLMQF